jgi:hypothetical protein
MSENNGGSPSTTVHLHTTPQGGNGLAVASLVLGILSLLFVWIPLVGMISWVLSIVGLVLGLIGLGKPEGRGLAIAGSICSGVGLVACIGWVILFAAAAAGSAAS